MYVSVCVCVCGGIPVLKSDSRREAGEQMGRDIEFVYPGFS